jgi:hypothetical protein
MAVELNKRKTFVNHFRSQAPYRPFPWIKGLFRWILFLGFGALFLWMPTRWLMDTFREYTTFERYKAQDLLVPADRLPRESLGLSGGALLGEDAAPEGPEPVKKPRLVVFRLLAPAAKEVFLGGTFNDFDARQHPLTRRADGLWETTLELAPGQYFYKFKVDGVWELDPTNPERTPDPRASSILDIQ